LQDHAVLFYNSNMMLCGAYRLTLYGHEHGSQPFLGQRSQNVGHLVKDTL